MRLDKFLSQAGAGSRSQVKDYIRQGLVTVNGVPAARPQQAVSEERDLVAFLGREIRGQRFFYYMLNKPKGVVCATRDCRHQTAVELLGENRRADIFPVGRLDKDTEGLLLLTNDGALAHRLLSPRRHVDKTYLAVLRRPPAPEELSALERGVDIGEKRLTLPVQAALLEDGRLRLTLREGKYHQIKRMLEAVDNRVTALKRVAFGGLLLDESLPPGAYRELTQEEVETLREA